jgi:hypothetical protein
MQCHRRCAQVCALATNSLGSNLAGLVFVAMTMATKVARSRMQIATKHAAEIAAYIVVVTTSTASTPSRLCHSVLPKPIDTDVIAVLQHPPAPNATSQVGGDNNAFSNVRMHFLHALAF